MSEILQGYISIEVLKLYLNQWVIHTMRMAYFMQKIIAGHFDDSSL